MTLWTASDAAAATGGQTTQDWQATGVSIDTRTIEPGDLFVALKDVRDGHDFVAQALEKGAAAVLVSRVPDGVTSDAPMLIVDDVLTGLEALGVAARARTQAKVIAVTGSVGKTSTKEMLRVALQGQGGIHAAEKSYNNHWGVPLTLARMPKETHFAIIEIGMNHPGEIAPLAKLTRPHVAVITTVAPAHLEAFDSLDAIAVEKLSIIDGLEPGGVAIVNGDVASLNAPAGAVRFGMSDGADWHLIDAETTSDATICRARHDGASILFKLAAPGVHFAMNGLATLAAIDAAGGDLGQAVPNLGLWMPPAGRGQRHFVALDAVDDRIGIDLIDDAYNANPASVAAALGVLSAATPPDAKGRRIAILGDMKELGPSGPDLHADLVKLADAIDVIHTVGPLMQHLHDALPDAKRGDHAQTADDLAQKPSRLVHAGDTVLVKGSLSMNMSRIVDAIFNLGHATPRKEHS